MRRFLKILTLIALLTILALIFIESFFSVLSLKRQGQSTPFYSFGLVDTHQQFISSKKGLLQLRLDPFIGHRHAPNQKTEYFTTDMNGHRGVHRSWNTDLPNWVILGGSTAFGTGLKSDREDLAEQLHSQHPSIQFLNAAMIGHSSKNQTALAYWNLSQRRVNAYIVLDGFNDVTMNLCNKIDAPRDELTYQSIEEELLLSSHTSSLNPLVRLTWGIPLVLIPQTFRYLKRATTCDSGNLEAKIRRAVGDYLDHQRKLVSVAQTQGAEVYCFLQPYLPSMFPQKGSDHKQLSLHTKAYNLFRKRLKIHRKTDDLTCHDLNLFKDSFLPEMFLDPIHLDSEGTKTMARLIGDTFQ